MTATTSPKQQPVSSPCWRRTSLYHFTTVILGVEVTAQKVDITERDEIVAVCRRGRERQKVPVLDLPLSDPRPEGSEWIDAYRHWANGR